MRVIVLTFLLLFSTVTRADIGNLRCRELDLASVSSKLVGLAQHLYPDSRDRVIQWIENSKNDPDPNAACKKLTLARDFLARIEGPRVLHPQKPDPKDYPERFTICSEPKLIRKKIDMFLKVSERNLYPKARIQVRSLLKQGEILPSKSKKEACALYDEIRNYILDLWPHFANKLR